MHSRRTVPIQRDDASAAGGFPQPGAGADLPISPARLRAAPLRDLGGCQHLLALAGHGGRAVRPASRTATRQHLDVRPEHGRPDAEDGFDRHARWRFTPHRPAAEVADLLADDLDRYGLPAVRPLLTLDGLIEHLSTVTRHQAACRPRSSTRTCWASARAERGLHVLARPQTAVTTGPRMATTPRIAAICSWVSLSPNDTARAMTAATAATVRRVRVPGRQEQHEERRPVRGHASRGEAPSGCRRRRCSRRQRRTSG